MPNPASEPKFREQLLREVYRVARIGTWEVNADDELIWSKETLELFGVDRSTFGGTMEEFYGLVHPDDLERVKRVGDFTDTPGDHFNSDYRIIRSDGALRHMRQTAIVLRDEAGAPMGFSGVVQDVTEPMETEAQLRQAQKMEAIGQLSGGVAHDFNNILAAIMGAAELLQLENEFDPELVESIVKSAKRGGELTRRLLAFARKQPLRRTIVHAPRLIEEIAPLLDRLVGQDVSLELDLAETVWPLEIDPAPLEESLVNLALNARDAITGAGAGAGGGKIAIRCANAAAPDFPAEMGEIGDFVEISVSDSGVGMSEDVRRQAANPFFTTKPVGKGSGLGLSMVEGYVKQSGGQMRIRSVTGAGTTVTILLPRARHEPTRSAPEVDAADDGREASVLVIEDNADFATVVRRQLESLNFKATVARDRKSAVAEANRANGFDIVLSDILLADGERGPRIVAELVGRYPDMTPLFMTGFAPDMEEAAETEEAFEVALMKPFDIKQLSAALKRAMASKQN